MSKLARSAAAALALVLVSATAHARGQRSIVATLDPARYPGAVCNNGEAATFNYKLTEDTGPGADDVDHRRKWLVILSGGGGCHDYQTCLDRWQESPDGPNLDEGPGDHWNMVPDVTARDFDGHGILDFDGVERPLPGPFDRGILGATANPFRGSNGHDGYNRVWVNYCSSDGWQGLGTKVAVSDLDFAEVAFDPNHPALTALHFGGARIVDAVIATILRGDVLDEDGNSRPDLVPAGADGEVVLGGSSAGGFGTIRNLDTVARGIHAVDSEIKVWGIPDAATSVGVLPRPLGDGGYVAAKFYTADDPTGVRMDDDCDGGGTTRCYDTGAWVVEHEISTPMFVVMQAFDMNIHESLKDAIAAAIRSRSQAYNFAVNRFGGPNEAAEAYIRFAVTSAAPRIGADKNNPAGLYIPNYETGWHQLMADSERFFNVPGERWIGHAHPGDPRLGPAYDGTEASIPTALAAFRRCVRGDYGAALTYAGCVDNARVINSTAIPAGIELP